MEIGLWLWYDNENDICFDNKEFLFYVWVALFVFGREDMDEKLTKIWKDANMRWRTIFIIISTALSGVFAFITQNILLTIGFIIATACIDLLVEWYKYIKVDFGVKRLFGMKKENIYILFITLAIFPACLGFVELLFFNKSDDQSLFLDISNNLISNILGALIVCSVIAHIKRFNYEHIAENLILLRKDVYNTFLKIAFFSCVINAVNFDLTRELPIMNEANKIYLSIIVFYGMIVFYTFILRIVEKTQFPFSIKEIYPTGMLWCGGGFLISCNISTFVSAFLSIEKESEPILLLINTLTAGVVTIGILILLSRRTENISDSYPWKYMLFFGVAIAGNCVLGFVFCKDNGNIIKQCISGGPILVGTFVLLLYLMRKQSINNKREKEKYFITVIGDEDFEVEKYVLEKKSIHNKNIVVNKFYSVEELINCEFNHSDGDYINSEE